MKLGCTPYFLPIGMLMLDTLPDPKVSRVMIENITPESYCPPRLMSFCAIALQDCYSTSLKITEEPPSMLLWRSFSALKASARVSNLTRILVSSGASGPLLCFNWTNSGFLNKKTQKQDKRTNVSNVQLEYPQSHAPQKIKRNVYFRLLRWHSLKNPLNEYLWRGHVS